jgi:hypothetical protein
MTRPVWLCMVVLFCLSSGFAQQSPAASVSGLTAPVPTLVNFGGTLTDGNGKPLTGIVGVTFYLYKDQQSSVPLWMETQNVQPDKSGRYSVVLGSTTSQGLPTDIFVSREARWLAVQPQGQPEQPRTLLLSVPYALKAADAETVGGLPPSAFMLAAPAAGSGGTSPATSLAASPSSLDSTPLTVGGGGTAQFVPLWTPNGSTLGNSVLFQSGTGSTANVGINTTTPSTTLDVNGPVTVRGLLNPAAAPGVLLSALGTATPTQGFSSTPLDLEAQSFNTAIDSGANYVFRWQAEPTGNDTSNTGATLHLLYGVPQSISETGLSINKQGILTFAPKQTFPGAGGGTVTSVGSGAGLTGGPITSSGMLSIAAGGITNTMLANPSLAVSAGTDLAGGGPVALGSTITLNLDTTKVPQLAAANTFTGNQTVNGNLSATGVVTGSGFQIGSNLFAFGAFANANAFLGFAGNSTMTGSLNTASGSQALYHNTTACCNTASGRQALFSNTVGYQNTASGNRALWVNTTGYANTAYGWRALYYSTTGNYNVAVGNYAGQTADLSAGTGSGNTAVGAGAAFGTGTLTNATAIGNNAVVNESNALVLGCIAGVNNCIGTVTVGIGTASPTNLLTLVRGGGPALADGWTTYSSRRWKTNIQTLQGALGKIEQLRGVSYDLKANGKHEVGVIAEEVGAVVPEVVSYEKNGKDAQSVDYGRLTALLIEATKEQQALIHKQQAQIARLSRQVKTIQATLKANERSGSAVRTVRAEGTTVRQ